MYDEHIEPVLLADLAPFRHEHLDPVAPELIVHSSVFDVAAPVQREVRVAFPEQDGLYANTLVTRWIFDCLLARQIELAKVVEHPRDREDVERAQGTFLRLSAGLA